MLTAHQTSTERSCSSPQAPEWLSRDLQAVLDYSIQDGDYETASELLDMASREGLSLECSPELYSLVSME